MKTRRTESSSFDLFLDTICNTFGGIVFLAILLAIMIQNRAIVKSPDSQDSRISAAEMRAMSLRLDQLSSEKESLQATLESLPEAKPNEVDPEYSKAIEAAKQREAELADLLDLQAKTGARLASQLEANEEQRKRNAQVPGLHEKQKDRLRQAAAEYAGVVEAKQQTLRLPRVRTSRAASILVLVQNNSMYLAKTPSLFATGFNSSHVTTKSAFGGGIQVDPKVGAGWDLTQPEGQVDFHDLVQQASRSGHIMTLAVWPDSYTTFSSLRDAMIERDVFYQLWPQSESDKLVVFLGGGTQRIQ